MQHSVTEPQDHLAGHFATDSADLHTGSTTQLLL